MPSRLLEVDIARTCTKLLQLDGWRHLKTDPVSRREWGKGFGEPGMADSLYIRYAQTEALGLTYRKNDPAVRAWAQVLWIEWKKPKTGRLAAHQREWHEAERARFALTWIAGVDFHPSIEGFARFYAQSGLQRREMRLGAGKEQAR